MMREKMQRMDHKRTNKKSKSSTYPVILPNPLNKKSKRDKKKEGGKKKRKEGGKKKPRE